MPIQRRIYDSSSTRSAIDKTNPVLQKLYKGKFVRLVVEMFGCLILNNAQMAERIWMKFVWK